MATYRDVVELQREAHGIDKDGKRDQTKFSPTVFRIMNDHMRRIRKLPIPGFGETLEETAEVLMSNPSLAEIWVDSSLSPEIEAVYQEWLQRLEEYNKLNA